jgi:hypothetical protein
MTPLIAVLLLLAIPLDGFRMSLAVLLPVLGVRGAPLLLAGPHVLGVRRIVPDSFPVMVAAPLSLASRRAANALFRSINGWLENLSTVAATPARPHARFLPSSDVRSQNFQGKQIRADQRNIETSVEFLPRLCAWGLRRRDYWLRLTAAIGSVSHRP